MNEFENIGNDDEVNNEEIEDSDQESDEDDEFQDEIYGEISDTRAIFAEYILLLKKTYELWQSPEGEQFSQLDVLAKLPIRTYLKEMENTIDYLMDIQLNSGNVDVI